MAGDCKAGPDNEFGFVWFFEPIRIARVLMPQKEPIPMFVFDRSPFAVVIPLALLVAVVLW